MILRDAWSRGEEGRAGDLRVQVVFTRFVLSCFGLVFRRIVFCHVLFCLVFICIPGMILCTSRWYVSYAILSLLFLGLPSGKGQFMFHFYVNQLHRYDVEYTMHRYIYLGRHFYYQYVAFPFQAHINICSGVGHPRIYCCACFNPMSMSRVLSTHRIDRRQIIPT